jgi:NAD(P)-dependent dehydrogenase (short-subunit alcohol dehydrogenase family)
MSGSMGTILVTGANGGLGTAIVHNIISSPDLATQYYGFYTVRDVEKATALNEALESAPSGHKYEKMALDLSKLSIVREVADTINKRVAEGSLPRIRALILNAGYQEHTTQTFSSDDFDMSFQANYLSHWLLTLMLPKAWTKRMGGLLC